MAMRGPGEVRVLLLGHAGQQPRPAELHQCRALPSLQVCKSLVRYGTATRFDATIQTPGLPDVKDLFTVSWSCFVRMPALCGCNLTLHCLAVHCAVLEAGWAGSRVARHGRCAAESHSSLQALVSMCSIPLPAPCPRQVVEIGGCGAPNSAGVQAVLKAPTGSYIVRACFRAGWASQPSAPCQQHRGNACVPYSTVRRPCLTLVPAGDVRPRWQLLHLCFWPLNHGVLQHLHAQDQEVPGLLCRLQVLHSAGEAHAHGSLRDARRPGKTL